MNGCIKSFSFLCTDQPLRWCEEQVFWLASWDPGRRLHTKRAQLTLPRLDKWASYRQMHPEWTMALFQWSIFDEYFRFVNQPNKIFASCIKSCPTDFLCEWRCWAEMHGSVQEDSVTSPGKQPLPVQVWSYFIITSKFDPCGPDSSAERKPLFSDHGAHPCYGWSSHRNNEQQP